MAKRIIIAIDGHSACGKSTLAKDLARLLEYHYVDSGALYRATTHFFLAHGVDPADAQAVEKALSEMDLDLRLDDHGNSQLYLGEMLLDEQLRTAPVNKMVSEVAALLSVRQHLLHMQQNMGLQRGVVMDGRDIGSVVFADAELKIFLTASIEIRAQRRFAEVTAKGIKMSLQDIKENLKHRDHLDSTRAESPLVQTADAVVIDNSNLTRQEQLAMILALAKIRAS